MAADPLAALRDIHLPPEPGMAADLALAGLLGVLVVMILAGLALWLARRPRGIRSEALAVLDQARGEQHAEALLALAVLLRRIARSTSGDLALTLRGDGWLEHLDRLFGTDFFTRGEGRIFGDALYAPHTDFDAQTLATELRDLVARLP